MMNKYDLAESIGMVRDFFVEEAMDGSRAIRDRIVTKWSMAAASVCMFVLTALFAVYLSHGAIVIPPIFSHGPSAETTGETAETDVPEDTFTNKDTSVASPNTTPSTSQKLPSESIKSWAKFIATAAGITAVCVLAGKSLKYIRALWKRSTLLLRLHRICSKRGYKLEKLSSCYRSVFTVTDSPELLITTPEKKLAVKLFTCLRYKDTYTLADTTHFTTKSNMKMMLVDFKYPSSGISNVGGLWMPKTPRLESGVIKEVEVIDNGSAAKNEQYPDAEKILCFNPISVEIRRVAKSTTEQIFDGDKIDGHTVYSGGALCKLLKEM